MTESIRPARGEHYGVPARPYQHGKSRIKLVLCPDCRHYLPALHPCTGPREDEENDD